MFDGPRLWRLGDTKGYANQTLVVLKVCSTESSVNWYGDLEQLNSSVNTDSFIQRLISARSQVVHEG